MKYRVTALLALAAVVAVPALASAATLSANDASMRPAIAYPNVVIPRDQNDEAASILFKAERSYLAKACPSVSQHPGDYSATLNRFCSEYSG